MEHYGEDGDTIKTEAGDISLKDIISETEIGSTGSGNTGVGGNNGNTDISQLIEEMKSLKTEVTQLREETNQLKNENKPIDNMYPVGSIYISTSETNPSELFGGTWESYGQGRTLVGAGTSDKVFVAGQTGGESSHTLTVEEMPSHSHKVSQIGFKGTFSSSVFYAHTSNVNDAGNIYTVGIGNASGSEGGSKTHNNLQPYIVTYMWKRVS